MTNLVKFTSNSLPTRTELNNAIENVSTLDEWERLDKFVEAARALADDPIKKQDIIEAKERLKFKLFDMKEAAQKKGQFQNTGRPKITDSGGESVFSLRNLGFSGRKLHAINLVGRIPKDQREEYIQEKRDRVVNRTKWPDVQKKIADEKELTNFEIQTISLKIMAEAERAKNVLGLIGSVSKFTQTQKDSMYTSAREALNDWNRVCNLLRSQSSTTLKVVGES